MESIEESVEAETTASIIDSYLLSEPPTTKKRREIPDRKNHKKFVAKPSYVQQSKHHSFEPWANSAGSGIKHDVVNLAVVNDRPQLDSSKIEQPDNINGATTSNNHTLVESKHSDEYGRKPIAVSKSNRAYRQLVPLAQISQDKDTFNASQGNKFLEVPKSANTPVNVRSSKFGHTSINISELGNRFSSISGDTSHTLVGNETWYTNADQNNKIATPHSVGTVYEMPPSAFHTLPTPIENKLHNKQPYINNINNTPQLKSIPKTQEHSLIPHARNEDTVINTELQPHQVHQRLPEIHEESPAYQEIPGDSVAVLDLENSTNTVSGQKPSIGIPIQEAPMTPEENVPRKSIFGWFKSFIEKKEQFGIAVLPMQDLTSIYNSPDARYGAAVDPDEYGARYEVKNTPELQSNVYPIYSYAHNVNGAKGQKYADPKSSSVSTAYTNEKGEFTYFFYSWLHL